MTTTKMDLIRDDVMDLLRKWGISESLIDDTAYEIMDILEDVL